MIGVEAGRGWARRFGFVIAALLALGACGGGSSPVAPPVPQPPVAPTITFVGQPNAGGNAIVLTRQSGSASELVLTVTADSVADLYGFGLDVIFNPTILSFVEATPGTFLSDTGVTVTTQVTEPTAGTLVIGQSRVGVVAGVSGTGVTMTLRFQAVAAGTTTFTVANAQAFDSTGADLMSSFFGGSATVPSQ